MPISYGNVCGRKYTTIQPEHDPENPKPTRYPSKQSSWAGPDERGQRAPETKAFKHGIAGYRKHHCDCDVCRAAYDRYTANERERKNAYKRARNERDGRVLCRLCHKWQEPGEFPNLRKPGSWKYVCRSCRDKGVKA